MMMVTCNQIPHRKTLKTLGLVKGNTVRARSIIRDVVALIKNFLGGEIEEYTKLMAQSREQSLDRMVAEAKALGANAIVGVKFSTINIMTGAAEILVYGTAVIIED